MPEETTKIVIAMLENGYIQKLTSVDKNIQNINKAIQEINKELVKAKYANSPEKIKLL